MIISTIIFIIAIFGAALWIKDWIEFENYMSAENRAARREMYVKKFTAEHGYPPREEPGDC